MSIAGILVIAGCSGNGSENTSDGGLKAPAANELVNGTPPTDGPAENGGILTINDTSDSPTLDPHKTGSAYTHLQVSGIVYSKLLEFKTGSDIPYGSMGVRGDLAETWDHSEDGTTWTFNLHKGVKWQNVAPVYGRAFTSADVACTINRIKTLPGVQKNLVDVVQSVETPDDNTVVFKLNTAYAAFDETMASFYMEILPCEGTSGAYDLATTAIGTGPFILQKWDRKVQKTYVKNPDYFVAGKPHLDGVNLIIQSDPAAAIAAFRTQQLDATGSITDTLLPTVISTNQDAVVRAQLGLIPTQMFVNSTVKPFDDIRVRKALAMAWDRSGMGDTFQGAGFALSGPFPSTLFGAMTPEQSTKIVPYDPAAAKKLLAEAGYPDGLSVELMTTDGYGPTVVNSAQWIQEDLKAIGVKTTLKIIDYATYFSTWQAKDYTLAVGLQTPFLTADEWLNATYRSNGPRNWYGTNDQKLDTMIDEQRGTLDRDEREKQLQDISTYIETNVLNPIMGYTYAGLLVTQPYVHNMYTHPQLARPYLADVWLDKDAPGRK
ncbi:MAG: ABC-type dipeptide transport system, periplasmic component [Pseudonocardiales bacterium]|nr:ABC-type dipeptide transport system, periplasmic component [Pseudonocardiales bacterium]